MGDDATLDALFRDAVAAIDAGDVATVERLAASDPRLVRERLTTPGTWLSDTVGDALEGFFKHPYLLWFVAEDPVRNGRLPINIALVTRSLIAAARRAQAPSLEEQLDYALRLVCWSWIARQSGVQLELIDALIDAGASVDGHDLYQGRYGSNADAAVYNGNFEAARHLLERGVPISLSTALCLDRWDDVERLVALATLAERNDAFVQASLAGNAEALRRMLAFGVDPTTKSGRNQSHGTALHHAVWSGSLGAVQVLVEAGADLSQRDTVHDGTPLGWAEYGAQEEKDPSRARDYAAIAQYLRDVGCTE